MKTSLITDAMVLLVHALASVAFFNNFFRWIFICSSVAIIGLSGCNKLFVCLLTFLAGFVVVCIQSSLADGLKSHLHVTQKLLRSFLMEHHDGELNLAGHPHFHGAFHGGILIGILLGDVQDGWLGLSQAPLILLGLQFFRVLTWR